MIHSFEKCNEYSQSARDSDWGIIYHVEEETCSVFMEVKSSLEAEIKSAGKHERIW